MAEKYKFTYFDTPGYGQPIRYLFALSGAPFEEVRLPLGDRKLPQELKETLPWGQVPILEFNGKKLAQSSAITRYVARKFGFAGADDFEAAKCDEYVDACKDFIDQCRGFFLEQDADKKAAVLKTLDDTTTPLFYSRFEKILKANGSGWLVGSKVTWTDLYFINFLEIARAMASGKNHLDTGDYPLVKALFDRVLSLPQIKTYREEHPNNDPLFNKK